MIEFTGNQEIMLWGIVCIACLIVELCTNGLFMLFFAVGCIFAALSIPFMGFSYQIVVFLVSAVLCLIFVRPFVKRYVDGNKKTMPSNMDALIGRSATVTDVIDEGEEGRVAVDGDNWRAREVDEKEVLPGEKVTIVGYDSIVLKVKLCD